MSDLYTIIITIITSLVISLTIISFRHMKDIIDLKTKVLELEIYLKVKKRTNKP